MGKKGFAKKVRKETEIPFREEDQQYGLVETVLGQRWFTVKGNDGKNYRCHVPGMMRRNRVLKGDIVLFSVRDLNSRNEGDILYKYENDEIKKLRDLEELGIDVDIVEDNDIEFS